MEDIKEILISKLYKGTQIGEIMLNQKECEMILDYIRDLEENYQILQDDYNNLVER